jgi:hypothetical protein
MTQTIKVRKHKLNKNINRSMLHGGDPNSNDDKRSDSTEVKNEESVTSPATNSNNTVFGFAPSTLSNAVSGAASDGLSAITTVLSNAKMACGPMTLAVAKRGATTAISLLGIKNEYDKLLQKLLQKENVTMTHLFTDCINALECNDIDIFIEILPKVFVIDKIGKLLETPDLSNIDEATKKSLPLFDELKEIINTEKFQTFICRILNEMESKEHIPDGCKEKFIGFYVGPEKAKEICESKGPIGSIKKMGSSFMTSVSNINNSAVNTNDKRCGEDLIVKKSIFSGEYCAPKPAPKVVEATKLVGEAPVITNETPANPVVEAAKPEQAPPPADITPSDNVSDNMKGGKGQKYKRVNKSKKNKKSKSKKSKRAKK